MYHNACYTSYRNDSLKMPLKNNNNQSWKNFHTLLLRVKVICLLWRKITKKKILLFSQIFIPVSCDTVLQ